MSKTATKLEDYESITKVIEQYIRGAKSGDSELMRPVFHKDATIFGYVGSDLLAGPIELLFNWNEKNGAAKSLSKQIANIDLVDSVAYARVELENWTGYRFTDLFTLLKVDGQWKIMNKVFHLHAE